MMALAPTQPESSRFLSVKKGEEELGLQLPCKINATCTLLVIHSIPVPLGTC